MVDVFEPIRSEVSPSEPPRHDEEHVVDLLHCNKYSTSISLGLHQALSVRIGNERLLPEWTVNVRDDFLPPSRRRHHCLWMCCRSPLSHDIRPTGRDRVTHLDGGHFRLDSARR